MNVHAKKKTSIMQIDFIGIELGVKKLADQILNFNRN